MPLEVAVLLCAGGAFFGGWLSHLRTARRLDPRRNPLRDLLRHDNLGPAIDLAKHRDARRHGANAVLHGRIDQFAAADGRWSPEVAEAVCAHVVAVMRVALRRQDRIAFAAPGSGIADFTILIPGADERAGVRVADRLRRNLAGLRLPQLGPGERITASFGVAADRVGESREGLEERARRALEAAVAQGEDRVVPASAVEEIILLPAPASCEEPAASAA